MLNALEYRAQRANINRQIVVRAAAVIAENNDRETNNIKPGNNMIRGVRQRQVNDPSLIFFH